MASAKIAQAQRQLTFAERLDEFTRRAEQRDPAGPARAVFFVVLSLMALGMLLQLSHAATTLPRAAFRAEVTELLRFRVLGLVVLLVAYVFGPRGVGRFVPFLTAAALLMLVAVYIPGLQSEVNGSRRWLRIPGVPLTFQPSEVARVVAILWVARRCAQMGPRVQDGLRGYLPLLGFGLVFFMLILGEPDLGGALLFLLCYGCTMWMGGARPAHVATSVAVVGSLALIGAAGAFNHVRERLSVWVGERTNDQVARATEAIASGDLFGVGLTHGGFRNQSLQYMQTDFALSLVGEELGFVGVLVVLGLLLAFGWFSLRLVLSVRDRYAALAAFGLLVSVAFQAMLHVQVVTGLAPPKGMTLPFISDGGSALVASCLAVGLALGAARPAAERTSST